MSMTGGLSAGKLLFAGLVVVGLGGGATYVAMGGELPAGIDNPFASTPGMVDTVPEDVDYVVQAKSGAAEHPTTAATVNGFINVTKEQVPYYDGPDDYEEWLEEAESEGDSELEIENFDSATIYGTYPEESFMATESPELYIGILIQSDWSEEDFIDAVENETEFEEDEYEGYTVYVEQPPEEGGSEATERRTWIGVLGEGQYVLGFEDAVKDAIDVRRGEEETFEDELRTAFDDTRDGYFRFAMSIPTERLPDESTIERADSPVDLTPFRDVEVISGAYYTVDDETIGMSFAMEASDESDAEDIADVTDGAVSFVRGSTGIDEVETLLDQVTVEREGTTVTVRFESEVETLVDTYESVLETRMNGTGGGFGGGGFGSVEDPALAATG